MTIVVIMLLTMDGFIAITELSMQAYLSLFSMVIGAVALGLCFAVIGFWLSKPVGIMNIGHSCISLKFFNANSNERLTHAE